jgi:large subunit ribosomal protein L44
LGKQAIIYYTTEYLHCKYPNLPVDAFKYATSAYTSAKSISTLGYQLGLQHVMRWERPQVNKKKNATVIFIFFHAKSILTFYLYYIL